jgi:hypothetical protein
MKCPKCEWENPDDATQCANCQADLTQPAQPVPPQQQQVQPPQAQPQAGQTVGNYMVWSIVLTVVTALCCNPIALVLGIIGIVKSSSANSKKTAGDLTGALADANTARMLCIIGTVLAALSMLGYIAYSIWSFGYVTSHMPSPRGL